MVPNVGIANTSMDKRNTQQRKRRAEMTAEQLEAKRRKNAEYQRQYRARKKAELQHANNTSNDNQANVGASSQFAGTNYMSPKSFRQLLHKSSIPYHNYYL